MKRSSFAFHFLLLTVLSSGTALADLTRGTLEKRGEDFYIKGPRSEFRIVTNAEIRKSLPSLESPAHASQSNGKKYAFEFDGEEQGDVFALSRVPTKVPGSSTMEGKLEFNQALNRYSINGKEVKFGYTKNLYGYEFDEISRSYFVEKEIIAEGHEEKGIFVMNSLAPKGIFSADPVSSAPREISDKLQALGAKKFLLSEVPKNEISQSSEPFRVTIAGEANSVGPGDNALIITLSGRQGDSFGTVNGHFAAGMAVVEEDLELRSEVSNAYVVNEKDILSGNTSLENYYFHMVQGQNQYRPTYTLVAYGVGAKKLREFRNALEEAHITFRATNVALTPQYNCTTESVKVLRAVGIKGKYSQMDNSGLGILTAPLSLFGEKPKLINYSLKNDASRFHPRPAYNSFLKSFLSDSFRQKHGIKRVDFIFHPQIPSKRPVGGIALGNFLKAPKYDKLEKKYEKDQKLSPAELRPFLDKYLNAIQ